MSLQSHGSTLPYEDENYEIPTEEAIALARDHHVAGNFVLAERTYRDVLKADPDNPTVNHLLGALMFQVTNYDEAMHCMKRSVELVPDEKHYWSNYGGAQCMAEDYEGAIESLNTALKLDPDHIESLNRRSLTFWQSGDFDHAEADARKVLDLSPGHIDGYINLGISLAKKRDFLEAANIWKDAAEHHPKDARIWSNWSHMARENGHAERAEDFAQKALDLMPDHVDALNNLGCILRDTGRYEEAVEAFTKATNLTPKYYQAHHNKALCYLEMGRYADAVIASRYTVDFKTDYVDGYITLSAACLETGDLLQAGYAAQRAVQIEPENPAAHINLADVLYMLNRFDDGHAAIKRAQKLQPDSAQSYEKLASVYERLDETYLALQAINKAIELQPNFAAYYTRKAVMLQVATQIEESLAAADKAIELAPRMVTAYIAKAETLIAVNRMDEAEALARQAQEINDEFPPVYFTLSKLKKFKSKDDPDFVKMMELEHTTDALGLNIQSALFFAIAQAHEHMKDYDTAFAYYERGNNARKALNPYDGKQEPKTFVRFKKSYPKALLDAHAGKGHESTVPVFIVGMPRSGTTLTEQIISSHPQVYGAGELADLTRVMRLHGPIDMNTSAEELKAMGQSYLDFSAARVNDGSQPLHITDKMPGNYTIIGLIAMILPNAKIIHCARNPMDTCLSNYKQSFMTGQFWSYDLEDLADEYKRYLDLMAYWHEVLPGRILDINYEDTVTDTETQARRLIDFIGLEWDEACLEPHKQKRAVLTASKAQVTKPVYQSSVEKWRKYEAHFQPIVRALAPDQAL